LANDDIPELYNESSIEYNKYSVEQCLFDFPILEPLKRNKFSIDKSLDNLVQQEDRVLYALFWFIDDTIGSRTDKTAFSHLREDKINDAIDIWWHYIQKWDNKLTVRSYSAWNNLSTLQLLRSLKNGKIGDNSIRFAEALSFKRQLIEDDRFMFNYFAYKITNESKNVNNLEYSIKFHKLLLSQIESANEVSKIKSHISKLEEIIERSKYYPLILVPGKFKYSTYQIEDIKRPEQINYDFATIGATEKYFYELLKLRFPNNVLMGHTMIKFKNYLPKFADMIFCDHVNKIFIDIEIDEPYTLESKKFTHTFGEDEERDEYFLSENYFIIKFAEEQICKYPEACCDHIAQFYIHILTSLKQKFPLIFLLRQNELPSITVDLPFATDIPRIKRWTENEANTLAASCFRNSYLHLLKSYFKFSEILTGIRIEYYENGNIESIFNYKNGVLISPLISFHQNGNVEEICNLLNEEKNGAFLYFDENGKLKASGEYVGNRLNGMVKIFDSNNKHVKTKYFENDLLVKSHILETGEIIIKNNSKAEDDDSLDCEYFF